MKKISVYLLIIICLFITGCGSDKKKNAITLDEFESAAELEGFNVIDNMDGYVNVSYILESKVAKYDDIEIEMIKYSDSDYASQVQEQQVQSFNMLKSTGAFVEKEKGSNYYKYALISNNRYMISTRVDDTLIFAKVMLEERENIDKVINELGY